MPVSLNRHGISHQRLTHQLRRFKRQSLKIEKTGCTFDSLATKPMTLRSDGRRVISATMQPDLYERLYAHCRQLDIPITVFMREAIKAALPPEPEGER